MRILGWSNATPGLATLNSGQARITRLVRSHGEFIWRVLRRLGLSHADAQDASQQVFMILARKLDQLPHDTERVFLYGAAVRVAANARRGLRRRGESDIAQLDLLASPLHGPELMLQEQEQVAELDALLSELPDELRRVLVLSEIEGLSGLEIAELENIPAGTVRSRLRRARELFRTHAERSTVLSDRVRTIWQSQVWVMSEENGSREPLLSQSRERAPSDFLSRLERSTQEAYRSRRRARRARRQIVGACLALGALGPLLWVLEARHDPPIVAEKFTPNPERSEARKVTSGVEPVPELKAPAVVQTPVTDRSQRSASPSAKPRAPALSQELRVLAEVRRALANGEPKQALLKLDQHGDQLKAGQLRLEAEVLRLEALSKLGAKPEASRRAQRFIDQNPHSPLADRVRGYLDQ